MLRIRPCTIFNKPSLVASKLLSCSRRARVLRVFTVSRADDAPKQFKRRRVVVDARATNVNTENIAREKKAVPHIQQRGTRRSLRDKDGIEETSFQTNDRKDRNLHHQVEANPLTNNCHNMSYQARRAELLLQEKQASWDAAARSRATPVETKAQWIIFRIREHERINLYGDLPGEAVPNRDSTSDMGGRYLVNKPRIESSRIFEIARQMPKGAHLHLHFNSELPPEVLLPHARSPEMKDTMFVRCTQPLRSKQDYAEAEVVFNVLPEDTPKADIFSKDYNPDWRNKNNSPWMRWRDFREHFRTDIAIEEALEGFDDAECWAREKMSITRDHAYNDRQTHNGAWACFNQGTRAFKGLLNYESIYQWYIGHAIDSMIRDKVMYAELRPMLMDKAIPSSDGTRQLGLKEQMQIICREVRIKNKALEAEGKLDQFPFGLKIIYCTPRSISKERMLMELDDCFKLKKEFPELICGFDLVGAEDRPNCINFYADLLVDFTERCQRESLSIPFMFHAGETLLDTGGTQDPDNSNLYDALLLNAKRIGHGYSLLKHPLLIEKYKSQDICLELCPISNELLHLCGNAREHPFPGLLAAGLHCTLNADNPSLFRGATYDSSSLSHEFYQVMVGDTRMTLHGWKQLVEWSIEHSCLTVDEIGRAKGILKREWEIFCEWVVTTYGDYADSLPELP